MNLLDLSGKCALVVGVGGLGAPIAVGLAEQGASVVAADLDQAQAELVAEEVGLLGRPALGLMVDVTSSESVLAMAGRIEEVFPRVDILVNCVGVAARMSTEEIPIEKWEQVMRVNIQGTFLCCQVFGKEMIKRGGGKIINMSSVRGHYGVLRRGHADYCASKGAVDALTRALAAEWGVHNICVNAVAPTVVETKLTAGIFSDPKAMQALCETTPLGRWATSKDIVGPVVFLASSAADFVTGHILYVDGGLTSAV
jgi:NAD(P)-dependent dehydrogenase (short-subunit alcohol dehydrogenase family)